MRAVRTRSTATRKLAGWGILAAVGVVIVAIFLITRAAAPSVPVPANEAVTAASAGPAVPAASQATVSSAAVAAPSEPASSSSPPSSSAPAVAVIDPGAMDQETRRALLTKLIRQGIFTGVQAVGSPPKVGVTPLFEGLAPTLQQQFIGAVYAYVNNGSVGTDPLQVVDATTGKVVGSYTAADGLKLL